MRCYYADIVDLNKINFQSRNYYPISVHSIFGADIEMLMKENKKKEIYQYLRNMSDLFVISVLQKIKSTALDITLYLHDHLNSRYSGHQKITQCQLVQSDFSSISIFFHEMNHFNCDILLQTQIDLLFQKLLSVLKILSRLGGARSILENNSLVLLHHLQLFFQLYLSKKI
ncbi:MAG: hypothetical protein A3I77_08290 [Gammaproteobacteria bacterium RIFCSPLOWO2_02_FULL_42_14]|nr:MAG: hypothetical protein A3B71_04125 [Gammaproteobacteria bacterium RIFCSPHIGHO2_02_FULL_42_43]OGT27588.1 MAG: hypothetical protein A2624_00430 [Gammaproteobacteria bacterium RIFCSPHIGHO2_01_FULL_42_8]OGT52897.1 MAG: hypothetical protein A3E54_07400 [Gammaproteobacteria bacterium RIFCSPHIGHO2_12_FULL_41_25]OGT61330.1 MAG: hypothetical protein A3I77_08290 [Gammaproteobacteria bacterium RIFCSPLOWO2_02_FULL_42_14]OGT87259.1 MAG: hypothetical protein A3G86_02015 [Gammaproteobacteria bacterium R